MYLSKSDIEHSFLQRSSAQKNKFTKCTFHSLKNINKKLEPSYQLITSTPLFEGSLKLRKFEKKEYINFIENYEYFLVFKLNL